MSGVFSELALLLLISAAAGAFSLWLRQPAPIASSRGLLHVLRAHHHSGEVAIVAREDFEGVALKHLGAPTIIYPMRNAVDYAVEALTDLIRPKENRQ